MKFKDYDVDQIKTFKQKKFDARRYSFLFQESEILPTYFMLIMFSLNVISWCNGYSNCFKNKCVPLYNFIDRWTEKYSLIVNGQEKRREEKKKIFFFVRSFVLSNQSAFHFLSFSLDHFSFQSIIEWRLRRQFFYHQ